MSLTKATYSMIEGAPNNILDFGADPTGVADSTSAIQAFIDAGGGYVPPGTYNVSATLVIKNRIIIQGPKDSWSPLPTRNAIFKWTGAAGGNIFQASATAIGDPTDTALSSVRLQNFTIDGDNIAGVGLFIKYAINESVFDNISVIKCQLGIVGGFLYYCRLSNLTTRNCSALGMMFGAQYLNSFTSPAVNSVRMDNLRAANCGSLYNAVTNPFGFGTTNLTGGCGIRLNLNVGTFVTQITSENNYGPGVVFGGSFSNSINGVYLEGNAADAVADGQIAKQYGLLLTGFASGGTKAINTLYMATTNANIYVDDVTSVAGIFVIDAVNSIQAIDSASGTNKLIKILNPEMISASNVGYPLANGNQVGTRFDATYEGTLNTGTTSGALRNSRATIAGFEKQIDWASGATLTVCTVNVDCGGQTGGSSGSVLLNVNIGTGIAGTSYDTHSFTYLVSFAAWQKDAALVVANVNTNIVQLGTVQEDSATLLSSLTLSAVVTVTGTSTATIELQLTPTSTGTQVRNAVSSSAVFLSGGLAAIGRPSELA
jgi:hypothetical protein